MPSLRELQVGFRAALLADDETAIAGDVLPDGLEVSARLAVYRHHVLANLTAALEATFPVLTRLVDCRFFGWLADRYIRERPPAGPCLVEYGADLPDFVAVFPGCVHLPWLADVARLEWAMNTAMHAPDATPFELERLGGIAPAALGELVVRVDPSLTLLCSRWPIDAIWRANQPDGDGTVDLDAQPAWLEVRRVGEEVVFRALPLGTFVFRQALAAGRPLAAAVDAALERAPSFDVAAEFRALLDERALVAGEECRCEAPPRS
jgi:hypothetical protein